METRKTLFRLWMTLGWILVLSLSVTGYTYAWFSVSNSASVKITPIEGTTATQNVILEISREKDPFEDIGEAEWAEAHLNLLPVSTADLVNFAADPKECTTGDNGGTVYRDFRILSDTETGYYFHQPLYLRATAMGEPLPPGSVLKLYLNAASMEGLFTDANGAEDTAALLGASRLGIRFPEVTDENVIGEKNWHIFYLESQKDSDISSENQTDIGDTVLSAGQVLSASGDTVSAAEDPSEDIAGYLCTADSGTDGKTPLLNMEPETVYQMDVYFYLEGCDPQCVESGVSGKDTNLSLKFYGVVE